MSIRRKLATMEGARASTGCIMDFQEPLSSILGTYDGWFLPYRFSDNTRRSSLGSWIQELDAIRKRGVIWRGQSGGGSAKNWKADERVRNAMVKAGLIEVARARGALPGIRLKPEAMEAARKGLGLLTLASPVTRFLYDKIVEEGKKERGGGQSRLASYVCEDTLFGKSYEERPCGSQWYDDHEKLMALIVAGCVESRCSTTKHVHFRATGVPIPVVPQLEVETFSDAAGAAYYQASMAADDERDSLPDSDEVYIPLPASW